MDGQVSERWAGFLPPERKVTTADTVAPADVPAAGLQTADDLTLVRAAASGTAGAFDLIVERHQRAIYQLCYRYVANQEDAGDLTQEAFLRAYRGLHGFRGEASLRTWLYRIAVNLCLNRVATKNLIAKRLEAVDRLPSPGDDPAHAVLQAEQRQRVRAGIARLPRRQRTVLLLRAYQELPHEDIARIVGSSVGAVKANFFHALANLRKRLQEP